MCEKRGKKTGKKAFEEREKIFFVLPCIPDPEKISKHTSLTFIDAQRFIQNPQPLVRIPIPSLTEERRKEMVKLVKKHGEDAKVGLRMHRRDANEALKEKQKGGVLTEDELRRGQELVQKFIDDYSKKIDELLAHKEKDILSV